MRCRKRVCGGLQQDRHSQWDHSVPSRRPSALAEGKTERHGQHFKELLEKARTEMVITSEEDLHRLVQEVESIKNRYSNRSGFSPVQRQIGQWPRVPADLASDEIIDPTLVAGSLVDDLERQWEMRRVAQKAFVEHNARSAVSKALKSRARSSVEFQPGDFVYVYRVHKERKRKHGILADIDYAKNKPTWVGPGTVVSLDGANLWITVWGELWKVAREQCRLATNMEKHGVELVMKECKDLVEEYKRTSKKAGYKDLTDETFPEDEEEVEDSPRRGVKRQVEFSDQIEEMPYSPSLAPEPLDDEAPSQANVSGGQSQTSRQTIEEPETEGLGEPSAEATATEDESVSSGSPHATVTPSLQPPPEIMQRPDMPAIIRQSEAAANRLDGVPSSSRSGWRVRSENRSEPYMMEMFWAGEHEVEELEVDEGRERVNMLLHAAEGKKRGDFWTVDRAKNTITKHHVRKRKSIYSPLHDHSLPVPLSSLSPEQTTQMHFMSNRPPCQKTHKWTEKSPSSAEKAWWTGTSTFAFIAALSSEQKEALEVLAVEKKRTDEVNMRKESAKDLEEWKIADLEEWKKVTSTDAVRVLSLEESRLVREQLRKEGKTDRILPTKIARRYKPAEQPGEPATKKSRLCIRGDLDPDLLSLERFAPTVNTMNLAVMFQIAANENMMAQIGDLKNAFCQSTKLERKGGKLYFRLPSEGVEGVDDEQLVEIVAGCYGLADAPAHWRKSLTEFLKALGYVQSTLDPCIYKLYGEGRLQGMVAIEIDDLFMVGHQMHQEKIQELQRRFVFGKFVTLKETPQGAAFNGRRVQQMPDGEIRIDMQKFVEERLQEIALEKGRASQKKELATEKVVALARAACGALNWLAKEGRPDAAGPSSLLSSRLTRLTVEDLCTINEVIRNPKKKPDLSLRVQPLQSMKFAVVSDASFGNDNLHSQGGQMILCHEAGLQENQRVKTNLLWWRSARLQRVVNSTLAAETQSLSRGLGDMLWIMVLFEELKDEKFSIREWPQRLSGIEVMAMASSSSSESLKGSLVVVDAKSLYDQLCKETIGGQDKRTAIEIQIIREDLNSLSGKIRWIDHPAMLADPLTKIKGSCEPLYLMLSSGMFQLVAEFEHMQARTHAKENGQSNMDIRRFGVNKSLGSCEIDMNDSPCLTPNHAQNNCHEPLAYGSES